MSRLILAGALSLVALSGCASRYLVDANGPTYAAQANIVVKVNKTENREVHVRVDHLAPPRKIPGGYSSYAVWFRVPGHAVTKAGVLKYNEKHRRGELDATTPHEKFEVLITLEHDGSAQAPGQLVIMQKTVGAA